VKIIYFEADMITANYIDFAVGDNGINMIIPDGRALYIKMLNHHLYDLYKTLKEINWTDFEESNSENQL
jgi:hypothetical protein